MPDLSAFLTCQKVKAKPLMAWCWHAKEESTGCPTSPRQGIYKSRNGMQYSLPTAQALVFRRLLAVEHLQSTEEGKSKQKG